MMLRDLGARVIKVEQPGTGDEAGHFLPLDRQGESAYFAAVNRGKESIALDLKASADRAVFERLLARADVLVENYRPGVLDRLGYGYRTLAPLHPRLVLASISGFGQTGPYRHRAAYDVVVQAMSGMMSITGHAGGPPTRAGASIGDLAAALFACNGIQAALLQRGRSGRGSHVDVSMFEAQIAMLEGAVAHLWCTGEPAAPLGARHPGSAPFDAFRAADGHLVIGRRLGPPVRPTRGHDGRSPGREPRRPAGDRGPRRPACCRHAHPVVEPSLSGAAATGATPGRRPGGHPAPRPGGRRHGIAALRLRWLARPAGAA